MMPMIAQIAADWWAPLSQLGFAGAMLFWFTQRAEARLRAMEESIRSMPESIRDSLASLEESVDRMAKAALLQILSFEQHESTIKSQAKVMMSEIENKNGNR